VNGYFDPKSTMFYTDTDSMIITKSTFDKLKAFKGGKYVGTKLGQLEDEFPNDYLVSARFLAPKTYCLALLKKNFKNDNYQLAFKVRCKGIPHRGDVFVPNYNENVDADEELKKLDETLAGSVKELKDRHYVIMDEGTGVRQIIPHLEIKTFDLLLDQTQPTTLAVHYGSILRNKEGPFIQSTRWAHRSLGKISWWDSPNCSRVLMDKTGRQMTMCRGFKAFILPTADDNFSSQMQEDAMFLQELGTLSDFDFLM
jgi:hypothetical protein